jgi:hypothetical protein
MKVDNPSNYKFLRFEKSRSNGKKYDAILLNKTTKKEKRISFGAIGYDQYKDKALGIYSKHDHLDRARRARYRIRHRGEDQFKFSSGWFAWKYLW